MVAKAVLFGVKAAESNRFAVLYSPISLFNKPNRRYKRVLTKLF